MACGISRAFGRLHRTGQVRWLTGATPETPRALKHLPVLKATMARHEFYEPFEAICCQTLGAARAGEHGHLDEAAVGMAEAACRHARYIADRWFDVFADSADELSAEKLLAGLEHVLAGGEGRAKLAFRALDADGDGVISPSELHAYLNSFNTLYSNGEDTLYLDAEGARGLRTFCDKWTSSMSAGLLGDTPLDYAQWTSQPHGGSVILIDSFVEHAAHCLPHMASGTDRVIAEIQAKQQRRDLARLGVGVACIAAVCGLFYL